MPSFTHFFKKIKNKIKKKLVPALNSALEVFEGRICIKCWILNFRNIKDGCEYGFPYMTYSQ